MIAPNRTLALALAVAATLPAFAADTYKVDAVHSSVVFRIKHMNVSYAYGRFNDLSGKFVWDAANPAGSSINIEVKTVTVDTANEARDKHLRSAELFDVEKHPTITFKSSEIKKTGDSKFEMKGDLTFRGVTKSITVPLEWVGAGGGLRGESRAGFEVIFNIKRSDYGMTALQEGLGDDVRLFVSVEGVKE